MPESAEKRMRNSAIPPLGKSRLDCTIQLLALGALLIMLFQRYLDRIAGMPIGIETVAALIATVLGLALKDGSTDAFGLRRRPEQGWSYWIRLALIFGAVILVLSLIYVLVAWTTSLTVTVPKAAPDAFLTLAYWFLLYSPVVEEVGFRVLLTVALLPWLGPWRTVLASGILFAAVHIIRGNSGLDNFVAGFLLEWAYLRSGTILVPMAMHTAGNAIALTSHLANWAVLPDVI
jgi:uncharacterized protein